MPLSPEKRRQLNEIEARVSQREKEIQAAPEIPVDERDFATFPGFSGGVQASSFGGVSPDDLE